MPQCRPSAGTRTLYGVDWMTLRKHPPSTTFSGRLCSPARRPKFVPDGRHSPGNDERRIATAAIERVSVRAHSRRRADDASARYLVISMSYRAVTQPLPDRLPAGNRRGDAAGSGAADRMDLGR